MRWWLPIFTSSISSSWKGSQNQGLPPPVVSPEMGKARPFLSWEEGPGNARFTLPVRARSPALRGCPLPGKVLSATCVRHAVPHFILTTLKSVFLRLFTGEETEAERGDTPGGRRLGGAVAEFRRPNLLPSLDSLPPQPFVGGVLTHPLPPPQLPGPA